MKPIPTPIQNQVDTRSFLPRILRSIKDRLPKQCTFLSSIKTGGDYQILTTVNKEEYRFSTPHSLSFTDADVEELYNQILELCHKSK